MQTTKATHYLTFNLNFKEKVNNLNIIFISEDLPYEMADDYYISYDTFEKGVTQAGRFRWAHFEFFVNPIYNNTDPNFNWKSISEFTSGGSDFFAQFNKTFKADFGNKHYATLNLQIDLRHVPLSADQY